MEQDTSQYVPMARKNFQSYPNLECKTLGGSELPVVEGVKQWCCNDFNIGKKKRSQVLKPRAQVRLELGANLVRLNLGK
jgi:hypothetical protein